MNKDEYVIINRTKLLQKKDSLNKPIAHHDGIYVSDSQNAQIDLIEELIENSIELIPEIEKAFDAGCMFIASENQTWEQSETKEDYIKQLTLKI